MPKKMREALLESSASSEHSDDSGSVGPTNRRGINKIVFMIFVVAAMFLGSVGYDTYE